MLLGVRDYEELLLVKVDFRKYQAWRVEEVHVLSADASNSSGFIVAAARRARASYQRLTNTIHRRWET